MANQSRRKNTKVFTFATAWKIYLFLRLPFGLPSAPEVFQESMNFFLNGMENVECSMDDIFIYAKTKEELQQTIKEN